MLFYVTDPVLRTSVPKNNEKDEDGQGVDKEILRLNESAKVKQKVSLADLVIEK